MSCLIYQISSIDLVRREFVISLTVNEFPASTPLFFTLPAWTPGSYLIREYAGSITSVTARQGSLPLAVEKIEKSLFSILPLAESPVCVTYRVSAVDNSVRRLWISREFAFLTGAAAFLYPKGMEALPCEVSIHLPEDDWRIATALKKTGASPVFSAACYDELIDCPVMMAPAANLQQSEFTAGGALHRISLFGCPRADLQRLTEDTKKICDAEADFWSSQKKVPFPSYDFLISTSADNWGGLEHRNSVAAAAPASALPFPGAEPPEKYTELLALLAHEYFHAWNVKRMKPTRFMPYDLSKENYTTLLWFFEGFTEYYEEILLWRAGLISKQKLLERLSAFFLRVYSQAGHKFQSLSDSSFDTWIKLYRPDDNSPNTGVSYYVKGALAALALDLKIRATTQGRHCLDHAMACLWKKFSQDGLGLSEDAGEIIDAIASVSETPRDEVASWIHALCFSTASIPWEGILEAEGLALEETKSDFWRDILGIRLAADPARCVIASVSAGGSAAAAGLLPGDELIAADGFRLEKSGAEALFRQLGNNEVKLLFFRGSRLLSVKTAICLKNPAPKCRLTLLPGKSGSWPEAIPQAT